MVEKNFFPNQGINIVYPNAVNMIVVPNNQKNVDYYEYPSLSRLTNEINYNENGGRKSFSCKSKASTSHIPIRRT